MGTVLVVVIAGVIIAAIAGATLSGDPKPATAPPRHRRAPAAAPPRPVAGDPTVVPRLPTSEVWEVRERPEPTGLDERRRWRRLRSAALLVVSVVLLGSLAAGLLGAAVLIGYRTLDRALG